MYTIRLFGKFQVWQHQQLLTGLEKQKVQQLLAYLLLHRERPHSREFLASLLWGNYSTEQSKTYLRKTLWKLHAALRSTPGSQADLLVQQPGWVQFNAQAEVTLDIAHFEQTYSLIQGTAGVALDAQQLQLLREAIELYRGDLLDGWYDEWCLYERERLQQLYLAMLDKLIAAAEAVRDYEAALIYGERILQAEPARECTHRQLMSLYAQAGDRTAALRQYNRCAAILDQELGVEPDEETQALYLHLQSSHSSVVSQSLPALPGASAGTGSLLRSVLGRLRQYQTGLINLQQEIQQEIDAVEAMIKRS